MGRIVIQTPQGPKTGQIKGSVPTNEELNKIKEMFPAEKGDVFNYSFTLLEDSPASSSVSPAPVPSPEVSPAPVPSPEIEEEVENLFLRYQVGRMDNDEEKQNLLNQLLGQGTSIRTDPDTFVIDQEKVDPRIREKYGLADTGLVYLDAPGFTRYDFADFAGEAGPETIAAIGASIATTGLGFVPGMAIVGTAAGLAKALDEAVEWAQGLNRQSAGEVASSIAKTAALNATFEGGGRLLAKGIGRLIKGPGPEISAARVEELTEAFAKDNTGRSFMQSFLSPRDLAKRAAREEALSNMNIAIRSGAVPTVEAAAGKGLSARAQAIYEKLFKNPSVGQANYKYINDVFKQLDEGILDEKQATKLLTENNEQISKQISKSLANPDEAFDLSQKHFKDIVSKELAEYEATFVPSKSLPEEYTRSLQLAATLFKTESNNLYDIAGESMGKAGVFDLAPVLQTLETLSSDNPFVSYGGSLFKKIEQRAAEGKVSIGELQQLKTALRISRGDTELVSSAAQGGINKLLGSIDDLMTSKQIELAEQVAQGFKIETIPGNIAKGIGESYRKVTLNPGELSDLRQGLNEWNQANSFYMKGQDQFNNTALNSILKNAKGGFFTSNIDVAKVAIQPMNAPRLAMYLQAVTPTKNMAQKLAQPGATEVLENVRRLVDENQFARAEALVRSSGLEGTVPKIQGFIDELPVDDVFRVSQKKAYLQQIDDLTELSRAGTNPQVIRESVRNSLAKTWISQTKEAAVDSVNNFNPAEFAKKFTSLGNDVQDALFGSANAKSMREAMEAFQLSAVDRKSAQQLFDALPTLSNQPLKASIESMKEIFDRATLESQDAVLSAINTGNIKNPIELVSGLLKSPNSYQRLKTVVGDAELSKPGGVKDMVMNNLIHNGIKESFEAGTIQTGRWGESFKSALKSQNQNGALTNILGKDTVQQLNKLADNAVKISDKPIAGFGGLVQASLPLSLLAMLYNGMFGTAAATVTSMLIASRTLRNPGVLKLITSPKVRAAEYDQAIKAGANIPSRDLIKDKGLFTVYNANKLSNLIASEASIILGSGILGEVGGEAQKDVTEEYRKAAKRIDQGSTTEPQYGRSFPVEPPRPGLSYEQVIRDAVKSGNVPGSASILREIERNKLLGVTPTQ